MKKFLPYLFLSLLFTIILYLSLPLQGYVNTHDEDDNIVSGFLMARKDLVLSKDIFSHHLPGAYLISEKLDRAFLPKNIAESVFIHRNFIVFWNYLWANVLLFLLGSSSLWLIILTELIRANYLFSLFHAENMILYPMILLLVSLFSGKKLPPALVGIVCGFITITLSPLWPLVLIYGLYFLKENFQNFKNLSICLSFFLIPVVWVVLNVDAPLFLKDFFGYNALTYAPMVIKKPFLYTAAAFLAPGIVMFDFSLSLKIITIQLFVILVFLFNFKKLKLLKYIFFGLMLGIIGFRSTPRFSNINMDFHVLPWVITLLSFAWYKFFYLSSTIRTQSLLYLVPIVLVLYGPTLYFPSKQIIGKTVIRYSDNAAIVKYLKKEKTSESTLFTLPAHTLLYQQADITPHNKFLFFLPWMEQSQVLFPELKKGLAISLPTFIYIDNINFPYTPPVEVSSLLSNYVEIKIASGEPPLYKLRAANSK